MFCNPISNFELLFRSDLLRYINQQQTEGYVQNLSNMNLELSTYNASHNSSRTSKTLCKGMKKKTEQKKALHVTMDSNRHKQAA